MENGTFVSPHGEFFLENIWVVPPSDTLRVQKSSDERPFFPIRTVVVQWFSVTAAAWLAGIFSTCKVHAIDVKAAFSTHCGMTMDDVSPLQTPLKSRGLWYIITKQNEEVKWKLSATWTPPVTIPRLVASYGNQAHSRKCPPLTQRSPQGSRVLISILPKSVGSADRAASIRLS